MKASSFPKRLIESGGDDALLSDLLRAAKAETMGPSRAAGVLAAFETTTRGGAAPRGTADPPASGWRLSLPVRLGASLAVVCALGLGWRALDSSTTPPPSSPRSAAARLPEAAPDPAPPPDTTSATRVEDLPEVPATLDPPPVDKPTGGAPHPPRTAPTPRAASPKAGSSTPSAESLFHEELALVESARSALARGDAAGCLRIVDGYEPRFRGGVFADEIAVMRIEALASHGDRDRARDRAETFLRKNPESAYASRIRSVLSASAAGSASRHQ